MSEPRKSVQSVFVALAILLGMYVVASYSMVRPTPKKFQNWAGSR